MQIYCLSTEPLPILDGEIGASIPEALDQLRKNLNHFFASRDQFASCFATAMAPCRVPSKIRQRLYLHGPSCAIV